jgi:hypothetical protein
MSLLPLVTRANQNQLLFIPFSQGFNPSTVNVSSVITSNLVANTASISTLNALDVNTSTIFTNEIFIDSQGLTAIPGNLLLNGIPLVTASNISSLSEWSYDPAISTVQMVGQNLLGANIVGASNVSSLIGTFSTLTANSIFADTMFIQSTIVTHNFISTNNIFSDNVYASNLTSTLALEASSFNGYTVSDFLSTSAVVPNLICSTITASEYVSSAQVLTSSFTAYNATIENIVCSTINSSLFSSTPQLFVSSINGHEFNQNDIFVSTLNTDTLSTIVANVSFSVVSTLQFDPKFAMNVEVPTAGIAGALLTGLTSIGLGLTAIGSGIIASAIVRGSQTTINNTTNVLETINLTSQLQVSTIGDFVSSIYRESTGIPADKAYGAEIFTSTIYSPGMTLLRSYSDPINTPSCPTSTIQSFGPWVQLPNANVVSSFNIITLEPSTILRGNLSGATLEILESSDITKYGQLQSQSVALGGTVGGSNGSLFYQDVLDRAGFINNSGTTFTLAYTNDSNIGVDTLEVSTINMNGTGFINWDGNASIYEVGANTLFITNGAGTTLDIQPTGFTFTEAGSGGTMSFTNNLLTVPVISTGNLQVLDSVLTSSITVSTINSQPFIGFRGGQFYRSVNQNLPTGPNSLIFDTAKPWNSADFVQTDPSTFLCSTTGTYQIGINNTVAVATGVWTALGKSVGIQQDRSGAQFVVINSQSIPTGVAYGQSASALIDIDQGDKLRFTTNQTLISGSTISAGLSNVFDLNTFWDYQLLRSG